jgi:hypothetical protein
VSVRGWWGVVALVGLPALAAAVLGAAGYARLFALAVATAAVGLAIVRFAAGRPARRR